MAEKLPMIHRSTFLLPPETTATVTGTLPTTHALIILNQRLPKFSPLLWEHAKVRVCADGGANRLFDNMPELFHDEHDDVSVIRQRYKPDVIKGDMDSIRPDVLNFYRNLGTEIVDNSSDQDTTDLHKCITYVLDLMSDDEKSNLCILVAGALGGRFDHEMGNVNTLCRFSTTRIVLLSNDCLIQLLPSTRHHEINVLSSVEGPHCGLIPIGTPSGSSTTTGLEWNLDNMEMRFGGLVSTSNIVKGETVTVRSDSDLLWTISLKKQTCS
ncbi:putative thiamine diphosphokinase [Helianthus annuus]|uniref:Thiamine pyrophosphokinase n=2 Tax=Helianthus annuus TaxID=4232 RepID=A0A251THT0_HELAN|nr:thiamine pyrophosphokinase 1 isoform X1 [Helianthus annuus]KAF5785195.1 putative thiamine diphosphokinase [Helianthus annuus]KAJ0520440.1 putative thiamine diphosphokinase [Helianthus annuus]KAJ0528901.1 putative thiamine diphosphokinase [Helianthus annuus]KAJ0695816.1 putative thiamine diphosphokinase [Helianthus annuus]